MVPSLTLHDGVEIPQLGFGVFQVPPEDTQRVVEEALAVGYRHIDTAAAYRNEEGVGAAIAASGLPREEVFVTTKLWNGAAGLRLGPRGLRDEPRAAGLELRRPLPDPLAGADPGPLRRDLAGLRADPRARAARGRSASPTSASRTSSGSGARPRRVPAVNQVELHPRFHQAELRAWHAEHGIAHRGLEPARPGRALLDEPAIVEIAERHGRTPAQVILRWHLQLGNVVIPKSVDPRADPRELRRLRLRARRRGDGRDRGIDTGGRFGPDPATFVSP